MNITKTTGGDYRTAAQVLIGHLDAKIADLQSIRAGLMGFITHDKVRAVGTGRGEVEAEPKTRKARKASKGAEPSPKHPWRTPAGKIFLKDPKTVTVADKLEEERADQEEAPAIAKVQAPAAATPETGSGRRLGAETRAAMVTMLKLPEPFTAASVAVATGMDAKKAGIMLWRLAEGGYLRKVATGEYERTREFAAANF